MRSKETTVFEGLDDRLQVPLDEKDIEILRAIPFPARLFKNCLAHRAQVGVSRKLQMLSNPVVIRHNDDVPTVRNERRKHFEDVRDTFLRPMVAEMVANTFWRGVRELVSDAGEDEFVRSISTSRCARILIQESWLHWPFRPPSPPRSGQRSIAGALRLGSIPPRRIRPSTDRGLSRRVAERGSTDSLPSP